MATQIFRINKKSDKARIEEFGTVENLGELPSSYDDFKKVTGILGQEYLNFWFKNHHLDHVEPFFTPKYMRHSPTFVIAESMEAAQTKMDAIKFRNAEIERERKEKAEKRYQEAIAKMYEPAKGWYVVTLSVLVGKVKGNDGEKMYSFKVLANSEMDAYNKACNIVREGVKDKNVSFVYSVADNPTSALIEYVGVWNDETEIEYGPTK